MLGYKKKKINLFEPSFNKLEIEYSVKTLKSGFWASGSGTRNVEKFENQFKKYVNSKECIAVDSGTAALDLALNMCDIKNKEVLVPSLTFVSTVHAILFNGGIPVFVDVDPTTLCIDVNNLKEKITEKTKVVIPVHFGGFPCDIKNIKNNVRKNSLIIVDDAAHACGTTISGKKIGSLSDFTCFSFHPVKNLAMPKGGAISINGKYSNKKNKIKSLRWCGIDNRNGPYYDITSLGHNYYMDEISAAIGIAQLKKLDKMNSKRKNIAKRYFDEIKISEKMKFSRECSYHLYWILVKNQKNTINQLMKNGIEVGAHYHPVHQMSYYKKRTHLPITEDVGSRIITLPIHPNLSEDDVNIVIKNVNKVLST